MKKIYLLLLLLFFALPFLSIAQSNYKSGYVINLKGDTLRGYINYREWRQNPKSIDFKTELNNGIPQKLTVSDINYFEITGYETYERYLIKASVAGIELSNAPTGVDTLYTIENAFLQLLQNGKNCTLYAYTDDIKTRFYIKSAGITPPAELIYRVYFEPNNSRNLITRTTYQGQLIALAASFNLIKLQQQIQKTDYTASDLSKIVSKINSDSKYNAENTSSAKNGSLMFSIGAGLNVSKLKYEGNSPFQSSPTATSVFPQFNISVDNYVNPNIGRVLLRLQLGFTIKTFTVTGTSYSLPFLQSSSTQNITQISGLVIPQVIYNFYNTDAFKAFAGAGVATSIASYPTNKYSLNNGTAGTSSQNNFPEWTSFGFSMPFTAGITLNKKLEIFAAYYLPITIVTANYAAFSASINTYSAGLNYFISSKHRK